MQFSVTIFVFLLCSLHAALGMSNGNRVQISSMSSSADVHQCCKDKYSELNGLYEIERKVNFVCYEGHRRELKKCEISNCRAKLRCEYKCEPKPKSQFTFQDDIAENTASLVCKPQEDCDEVNCHKLYDYFDENKVYDVKDLHGCRIHKVQDGTKWYEKIFSKFQGGHHPYNSRCDVPR